jgi:hypothetical protein
MTRRWRPPPYWPPPPDENWTPPPGWQPDPTWPPPPPGWQFWENDRPSRAPYLVGLAVLAVVGVVAVGSLADDGVPAAQGTPTSAVDTVATEAPTTPPAEAAAAPEPTAEEASEPTAEPTKPKRTTKPKPERTSAPTTTKPKPRKTRKPANDCDPNYAGGCVPVASDVDCAGGSGNGPAYFDGPATVVGDDVYGLDSDDDGTACEKD